ncbi:MAG: hypothetical protein GWP91_16480, partial [Rhodobacterales bacterium]|nr:hypothetical protein [Rhodobacterales bacterium]
MKGFYRHFSGVLLLLAACGGPPDKSVKTSATTVDTAITDTGTRPGAGLTVSVAASGVIACTNPSNREIAAFDRVVAISEPARLNWFWGVGVVVADFNGDNLLDVMLPGYAQSQLFWGTVEGLLTPDHARLEGLPVNLSSGGSAVDYDGDGDMDLFLTRYRMPNVLLRNDGDIFTDVTQAAGLASDPRRSVSSSWADYDADGDLDLFVGAYGFIEESDPDLPHEDFGPGDRSWLYVNNGDGTFVDVSDVLPQEVHDGYTFVGGWIDLDGDSLPELYIVNDFGESQPNVLLWNRGGGVLEMDNNAVGLSTPMTGMGLDVGDFNEDGLPDFVMPEW